MASHDANEREVGRGEQIDRYREEMDWDRAEAKEGKSHGVVVSVRLDQAEADRLRSIASDLGLTMSQVLRRALASFDATAAPQAVKALLSSYMTAFTFGGTNFLGHLSVRPEGSERELGLSESGTVDIRVRERVG